MCCVWTSMCFLPRKCEGWNYKMNRVLPDSSISRGLAFFVACCGVPCHVEVQPGQPFPHLGFLDRQRVASARPTVSMWRKCRLMRHSSVKHQIINICSGKKSCFQEQLGFHLCRTSARKIPIRICREFLHFSEPYLQNGIRSLFYKMDIYLDLYPCNAHA